MCLWEKCPWLVRARLWTTRSKYMTCGTGHDCWKQNQVSQDCGRSAAGTECRVTVCDKSYVSRKRIHKAYPGVYVSADASEVLSSPEIDAVAIVTPVWTHFELAKAALENGKHVFVEKPFTTNLAQAEELIELAEG